MTTQVRGTPAQGSPVPGTPVHGRGIDPEVSDRAELLDLVRVIVVGAVPSAIVCTAGPSRLAMFVLRKTSPPSLRGTLTDDGFIIGQVPLFGF